MAETKKPIVGVLSALQMRHWDALSPEEKEKNYYASFPDSAYLEIRRLRELCTANDVRAESLFKISSEVLGLLKKAQRRSGAYFKLAVKQKKWISELERFSASERKRRAKLNPSGGTKGNQKRAADVRKAAWGFVLKRIKENPLLKLEELAVEIRDKPWAKKNMRGKNDKYSEIYLKNMIRPMVKEAVKAAREGRL